MRPRVPRFGRRVLLSFAVAALGLACARSAGPAPGVLVVRGVTLFDGAGGPAVSDAVIVVRDGRVERAGPRADAMVPAAAEMLDGGGRLALPGLVDLHQHSLAVALEPGRWVAQGVTSVRDPGSADLAASRKMREAIETGRAAGPRLFLGLFIDLAAGATPGSVRRTVADEASRGLDLVKLYFRTPLEHGRAAIEEAHARGLPVTWHLGPPLSKAIELGIDGVEHLYLFRELMPNPAMPAPPTTSAAFQRIYARWGAHLDPASPAAQRLLGQMADRQVVWTPTLTMAERIARGRSEHSADWQPDQVEIAVGGFEAACRMVAEAHRLGVPIGAGTDTEDPADLHRELELLVGCGLTPAEAIRSATSVAARALGPDAAVGVIRPGAHADLVLVDGDPLTDIRDIRRIWRVVKAGEIVSRQ